MGDMFLILAPSRGFLMAANPMASFALTPDRPWLPWQRKFENLKILTRHNNVSAS